MSNFKIGSIYKFSKKASKYHKGTRSMARYKPNHNPEDELVFETVDVNSTFLCVKIIDKNDGLAVLMTQSIGGVTFEVAINDIKGFTMFEQVIP